MFEIIFVVIVFSCCQSRDKDEFSEELFVRPISLNAAILHFQFAQKASLEPAHRNIQYTFPRALKAIFHSGSLSAFNAQLTRGKWYEEKYGQPLVPSGPLGIELTTKFERGSPREAITTTSQALPPLLSSTLSSFQNRIGSSTLFANHNKSFDDVYVSSNPREQIGKENVRALINLLPSGPRSQCGIIPLIDEDQISNSSFISINYRGEVIVEGKGNGMKRFLQLTSSLTVILNISFEDEIPLAKLLMNNKLLKKALIEEDSNTEYKLEELTIHLRTKGNSYKMDGQQEYQNITQYISPINIQRVLLGKATNNEMAIGHIFQNKDNENRIDFDYVACYPPFLDIFLGQAECTLSYTHNDKLEVSQSSSCFRRESVNDISTYNNVIQDFDTHCRKISFKRENNTTDDQKEQNINHQYEIIPSDETCYSIRVSLPALHKLSIKVPFVKGGINCEDLSYDPLRGYDIEHGQAYITIGDSDKQNKSYSTQQVLDDALLLYFIPCDRAMFYNVALISSCAVSIFFIIAVNSISPSIMPGIRRNGNPLARLVARFRRGKVNKNKKEKEK
ncbi:MAG: hypothetical protein EZS28_012477 [Streblomastix strix]|uniref:GPI transamidase component PIG-T n=1 Tax=Streblomastix strix TaxID=222440 RepID=A0A5J4WBF7_9EUKA|nr:MAG: hypothetical protein EZS28_012477 [Streblomastix strix]